MAQSVVNEHQPSLSEWLEAIGHKDAQALREEDIGKRKRLEVLRQHIGVDYDRVVEYPAVDFFVRTPEVSAFIEAHEDDLCALRLVPHDPALQKLRTRGRTLADSLSWLVEQNVDPSAYTVEFVEHSDTARWSSIFVVREDGIFGEFVNGLHFQLTQGNTESGGYAFSQWPDGKRSWSIFDPALDAHVSDVLASIQVSDMIAQETLKSSLNASFTNEGYLQGYFETLLWPTRLIFTDYNRLLHEMLPPVWIESEQHGVLSGTPACVGGAEGMVRIVQGDTLDGVVFNDGDILVTDNTDVRFLPLMRKAGAILTDRGGLLSHAAIVARELGIPCVVGTGEVTKRLREGDRVRVNDSGIIELL